MATMLSAPWVQLYHEIQAFFKEDPQIKVVLDEFDIKVYVDDPIKADALYELLNPLYNFGGITTHVTVIPGNKGFAEVAFDTMQQLHENAFKDNPALSYVLDVDTVIGHYTYVVFKNKVVQYYNDDLSDVNGMCSTLYQDIAAEIFKERTGVFYCTDVPDNLGQPLGEWP